MASDPQKELESILYQSRQFVGRLGASESQNEITRMHLRELRDAAMEIYAEVASPSDDLKDTYNKIEELHKAAGLAWFLPSSF
jgi:hypothetical protein